MLSEVRIEVLSKSFTTTFSMWLYYLYCTFAKDLGSIESLMGVCLLYWKWQTTIVSVYYFQ